MRRNTLAARALTAAVLTALLAGAAPVLAIEGHRPIHERRDIIEPGYYKFTRNVASGGSPIITVSVGPEDRVVIDLNCFTATQQSTNVPVIFISSGGNIVIKNGELRNGTYGIYVFPGFTASLTVSDIVIGNSGVDGISAGELSNFDGSNLNISDTGDDGIDLDDVDAFSLEDSSVADAGDDALDVDHLVGGTSGRIEGFTATSPGSDGMELRDVASLHAKDLLISGAGQDGLHLGDISDALFEILAIWESGRRGGYVEACENVRMTGFNFSGSADTGLFTDSSSHDLFFVSGSVSGNNKGVEINSARTTVRGVQVTGSAQEGVHVTSSASDTVVRESTSVGNVVWDLLIEGLKTITFQNLIGTTGP